LRSSATRAAGEFLVATAMAPDSAVLPVRTGSAAANHVQRRALHAAGKSMADFDFDLITLGAGSGGVAASRRAAAHGAKVAIVEAGRVGGTCVLRGCVPKKLLMYAAQYGDALAEAAGYGWQVPADIPFDMARWQAAKSAETTRLEAVYRALLAQSGVEIVEGRARFVDAHTIAVDGRPSAPGRSQADGAPSGGSKRSERGSKTITARHILIATGASPVRDEIAGTERCATSDDPTAWR
jgi:glutathione reductase (NADPH)